MSAIKTLTKFALGGKYFGPLDVVMMLADPDIANEGEDELLAEVLKGRKREIQREVGSEYKERQESRGDRQEDYRNVIQELWPE